MHVANNLLLNHHQLDRATLEQHSAQALERKACLRDIATLVDKAAR